MAADLFSLKDQIILVTGSSRGLGWVMAQTMAKAGARVILNGRDQKLLQQRLEQLQQANLEADLQ
ncbi:MAG: SDR family NAD(P)-dependent oxidoreductase, partial [Deltaproteobacteria bacterium]|nr:SDR family NAD(P)-dependent oxidoreductase [Deltaproteobacteria bacterium]